MKFLEAIDAMDQGHAVTRRAKPIARLQLRLGDVVMMPAVPFAPAMPAYFNLEDFRADDWEVC